LEKAGKLEPTCAAPFKTLVPLYLAFDRTDDALAACRKAIQIDNSDYETWCMYSRELKAQGQSAEALTALRRAFGCPVLGKDPDAFLQIASELAAAYEDLHEDQQALRIYRQMAKALSRGQANTKLAEVHESIGRLCLRIHRYGQSLESFLTAQRLYATEDPLRSRRLSYDLAVVLDAKEEPAKALVKLDDYLQMQPPGIEPYDLRVRILKKLDRDNEILPWLQDASDRDSHNLALKMRLAREFAGRGRRPDGERVYLQLAAESPAPDIYRELFQLYRKETRMGKVLELLDSALLQASGSTREPAPATQAGAMVAVLRIERELALDLIAAARHELHDHQKLAPQTRRLLGVLADAWQEYAAAEEFYRDYLADGADPQSEPVVYARLLEVLWAANKYEAVVTVCRKGLKQAHATNRALFHRHLARALFLTGQVDAALTEADQVVQLANEQNRLPARLFRAQLLSSADRLERAESECQELIKQARRPSDLRDIRQTLSVVYSNARQFDKAQEQLRLILEAEPDDATANNDLGYLLADQGKDLEEAEKLIRKAIQLDGYQRKSNAHNEQEDDAPNAAYVDSLGWVLFRRGRLSEARRELEKAVTLAEGKSDPVVWDHLGDVYCRQGDLPRAKEAWQKAVTLYESEKRPNLDQQYQALKRKLETQGKAPR
jgi:tetratricopeptide (TPR) repeat protein